MKNLIKTLMNKAAADRREAEAAQKKSTRKAALTKKVWTSDAKKAVRTQFGIKADSLVVTDVLRGGNEATFTMTYDDVELIGVVWKEAYLGLLWKNYRFHVRLAANRPGLDHQFQIVARSAAQLLSELAELEASRKLIEAYVA